MNNSDERDYEEEAYNRHILHTGDGEIENCGIPTCPYNQNEDDFVDDPHNPVNLSRM